MYDKLKAILSKINSDPRFDPDTHDIVAAIKKRLHIELVEIYTGWKKEKFNIDCLFPFQESDEDKNFMLNFLSLFERGDKDKKLSDKRATLLHIAAQNGYIKIIKALVIAHAKVNAKDNNGGTALHYAKNAEVVSALLAVKGIDVNVNVNAKDEDGRTPLYFAAIKGKREVIKALVEAGVNVNVKDNKGKTPLHYAKNAEVAEYLVKNGAKVNVKDKDGRTPLHFAANIAVAKYLIKEKGDSVHAKDKDGRTPLHFAANAEIVGSVNQNFKRAI